MKHEHKPQQKLEVCACGATRSPKGEWAEPSNAAGQALVSVYLANSTPEQRSENARRASQTRWKGKPKTARKEYMRYVASRPRPNAKIQDRCPCGKYSKQLAEKRGHKCEAAA